MLPLDNPVLVSKFSGGGRDHAEIKDHKNYPDMVDSDMKLEHFLGQNTSRSFMHTKRYPLYEFLVCRKIRVVYFR